MTVGPDDGVAGGGSPGYRGTGGSPGHSLAASGRAQMRVSTMDRDHAVDLLARAFAEGRLSQDEHGARLNRAMAAMTFAELDAVVADLPGSGAPAPPKTNQMAIASFVCGVGQVALGPLVTIPAIVCGHVGRRQIRRTGESGAGMALAGMILGYAGAAVVVLAILTIVFVFLALAHGG